MKIAICGAWHVHATDFAKIAKEITEVVGVYDENAERRHAFAKTHELHEFETLDELLASDAEGVAVATSSETHAEYMIKIANAKKHIFTEKVLALTTEDCLAVKKAVEENGVTFVISFPQKRVGAMKKAKEIADSGELGKINYVRFRNCHHGSLSGFLPPHFYSRKECGGGAMIDLGAHGMYVIDWILGMPKTAVSAFTLSHDTEKNIDKVEDNAITVMTFESGAIAVNETGFVSRHYPCTLEIGGEKGRVCAEGNGTVRKATDATEGKLVSVEPAETGLHPLRQFITGEIQDGIGIDEAIRLTQMMEMAYQQ